MTQAFYKLYDPNINYKVIFEYLRKILPFVQEYVKIQGDQPHKPTDSNPDSYNFTIDHLLYGDLVSMGNALTPQTIRELQRIATAIGFLRASFKFTIQVHANVVAEHLDDKRSRTQFSASVDYHHSIGLGGLKMVELPELFGLNKDTVLEDWQKKRLSRTYEALEGGFHIGDIIQTDDLRSGASAYGCAIVLSLAPLLLVSQGGDMVWSADPRPKQWTKIGNATASQFDQVKHRLEKNEYDVTYADLANFAPRYGNEDGRLMSYVMKGMRIIEEAELKARNGDTREIPFGMGYDQGMCFMRGLQAAYQHSLEMMAPPKNLAGLGELASPFGLSQRYLNALTRTSSELGDPLMMTDEEKVQKYIASVIEEIARIADDEIRVNEHRLKISAAQLALYLVTRDPYRYVNVEAIAQKAFERGVLVEGRDRKLLLSIFAREGKIEDAQDQLTDE